VSSSWVAAIEIIVFFIIAMGFGVHQLWNLRRLDKADAAHKAAERNTSPAPHQSDYQPNL
jgi:hypothetical protein